jgi:PAS domain-containing protein
MAHARSCYRCRMRLVCAYCRKVVREDPGSPAADVSHGMCAECEEHFGRLWDGMSVSEYLDTLPRPIVVLDGSGRIVAANEKVSALSGCGKEDLAGALPGRAFACVRSRLPEGCGKTVHCRECTIRRALAQVQETGDPVVRAPAWAKTDHGRVDLRITVAAAKGLVTVVVEDAQPAAEVAC